MMLIKQKGNRYYRYSWAQMRSFPIKKSEALELIKNDEAELVEAFITDPTPEPIETEETKQEIKEIQVESETTNVVSLNSIREAKNEKESIAKAKEHFTKNILPNLNSNDMKTLLDFASRKDETGFQDEMMRIVLRMSVEEGVFHTN
ncbi:hypothetical protein QJS65_10785 [Bacillus altitudinis]|uniref:hypothetical protein n=1 Tax=Bacillus altitudinis TaxID=293387 RepID=UPI0024A96BBE|nr:hypothetical protein [Bacillus altitudinis]WHF25335.1 hypothetical protein QJS65_10785 [Bacillus altitudinis]